MINILLITMTEVNIFVSLVSFVSFAKKSTTMDLKEMQGKCCTAAFVVNMLFLTDCYILLTLVQLVLLSSVHSSMT